MEIVSAKISQKNSRLIWLKFSDGTLLPLSTDEYVTTHLQKFTPIGDQQFLSIQSASANFLLMEYSLRQIALSPKVRKLLSQKLRLYSRKINFRYHFPANLVIDQIDLVVDKIESMGLLDVNNFVDYYARRHHRQSAALIKFGLHRLGIEQKSITGSDIDKIKSVLQKKYHSVDFSDYQAKRKIIAKLYQKGFALGDIKTAIDDYLRLLVE